MHLPRFLLNKKNYPIETRTHETRHTPENATNRTEQKIKTDSLPDPALAATDTN